MRAGALRHLVTIESQANTRSATGEVIPTWSTLVERWAEVRPLTGKEPYVAALQLQGEQMHRVRMRYDAALDAVTTKMRIKFGSRYFDIQYKFNLDERDRELHLVGEEIV